MTAATSDIRVVELRQYTTRPGLRDTLIDLFETLFVEPQEAAGARLLGQFRDLDDPDRFVWIRGFASMEARLEALTTFYDGPVWRRHREAAVATMRDSGNVLLLRPVGRFAMPASGDLLLIALHALDGVDPDAFATAYGDTVAPSAVLVTESAANAWTRHPSRVDGSVLACVAGFRDEQALDVGASALLRSTRVLREKGIDAWLPAFMRKPELVRLQPTSRSAAR